MDKREPGVTLQHQAFQAGSTVVYGFHGKCNVLGVENRQMGEKVIEFYKLEIRKPALSRSTKKEPAIWVPVQNAVNLGLRSPINEDQAQVALAILSSREYYFPLNESWNVIHPTLENEIRAQGCVGLAKVASYLHGLKRKFIVPPTEITKFHDTVNRLLFRELAEILFESVSATEARVNKLLKHKLHLDN